MITDLGGPQSIDLTLYPANSAIGQFQSAQLVAKSKVMQQQTGTGVSVLKVDVVAMCELLYGLGYGTAGQMSIKKSSSSNGWSVVPPASSSESKSDLTSIWCSSIQHLLNESVDAVWSGDVSTLVAVRSGLEKALTQLQAGAGGGAGKSVANGLRQLLVASAAAADGGL